MDPFISWPWITDPSFLSGNPFVDGKVNKTNEAASWKVDSSKGNVLRVKASCIGDS
jgi:hypothetical protein